MILRYTVTDADNGMSLGDILRRRMKLSSAAIRALKRGDGLRVDTVERFTIYRVTGGEIVTADVAQAETIGDNLPERGAIDVIYEDEGLLAVNKPAGLIVHPTRARLTGTLSNFAAGYLQAAGEQPVCHIINRLDRDTSGLVLFAKNAHMKARMTYALAQGEKQYIAVCWGALHPAKGVIDLPIRRSKPHNMLRIVAPDGRRAVTHYRTLYQGEMAGQACSILECTLETGRTHQIRVHCLAEGAPLIGDTLYFTDKSKIWSANCGVTRQLLHSHKIKFTHPLSGVQINLQAPIADAMFAPFL